MTSTNFSDPLYLQRYKNLQGNILRFHGRANGYYIFIRFNEWRQREVKEWIRNLAELYITSAYTQYEQAKLYKKSNGEFDGGLFTNFALSYTGYTYLQLRSIPSDKAFMEGMNARREILGDKEEGLSRAYKEDIHAMLFIAHDNKLELDSIKEKFINQLKDRKIGEVVEIEQGSVQKKGTTVRMVDGFGFVEGAGMPEYSVAGLIEHGHQLPALASQDGPRGNYNSVAPLEQILVGDMLTDRPECYGSYGVFRKYNLDNEGFRDETESLGKELNAKVNKKEGDPYGKNLAGAYMMGRFEDGTPVALYDRPQGDKMNNFNNFGYGEDPYGARCPFHTHVRKMNPRNNFPNNNPYFPKFTITRRGMNQEKDGEITGLLFLSFQNSILNQFEKLQAGWANISWVPSSSAGVDVIIGNNPKEESPEMCPELSARIVTERKPYRKAFAFPAKWGEHGNLPFEKDNVNFLKRDIRSFVDMKGGGYFFFPSIPGLKALKNVDPGLEVNTPMYQRLQYVITKIWLSNKDKKKFKEDSHKCLKEWINVSMSGEFEIVMVEQRLKASETFVVENGTVVMKMDITGKPEHLSPEQIRDMPLEEFLKYNDMACVRGAAIFNPYFVAGW